MDKQDTPWYVRRTKSSIESQIRPDYFDLDILTRNLKSFRLLISRFSFGLSSLILSILGGVFLSLCFTQDELGFDIAFSSVGILLVFISLVLLIVQIGQVCKNNYEHYRHELPFQLGLLYARGAIKAIPQLRAVPAPELALQHFVNQVKAYALEKSFQKSKISSPETQKNSLSADCLLKRRWNDVADSLAELEAYLSQGNPTILQTLVERQSVLMDVSPIFRDVAETFDSTWRRRGINIEAAVVSPLKMKANDVVLRRMLVGPWRACAYLARKGSSLIFSAKAEKGLITVRWDCDGFYLPTELLSTLLNSSLELNERIEIGLQSLAEKQTSSAHLLFALISFTTWADLMNMIKIRYKVAQTVEGTSIEISFS